MVTSTASTDQIICTSLLPNADSARLTRASLVRLPRADPVADLALATSSLSSGRGRGQWAQHASSPSRAANPHPRIPLEDQRERRAVTDASEMALQATGMDAHLLHRYPVLRRAQTRQLQPWGPTTQNASADRPTYRDRPQPLTAKPPGEAPGAPTESSGTQRLRPLLCEYQGPPYRPNRRIRRRHRDRLHTPRTLPAAAA